MLPVEQLHQEASPLLRRIQAVGYLAFFTAMTVLAIRLWSGYQEFGALWVVLLAALAGYLMADLLSGLVHFLADNFGSPETPVLGPGFVLPFRQHHVDPLGITGHGFFAANGNNALVCLPVLIPFVLFVPVTEGSLAYASGVFTFVMLAAVFLTNQTHKWAHMDIADVPRPVAWLQQRGLILSQTHHAIHHQSPFNTHYCITVGAWNRLFERSRLPDKLERWIRRWIPGTDPRLRVEQEMTATAATPATTGTLTRVDA